MRTASSSTTRLTGTALGRTRRTAPVAALALLGVLATSCGGRAEIDTGQGRPNEPTTGRTTAAATSPSGDPAPSAPTTTAPPTSTSPSPSESSGPTAPPPVSAAPPTGTPSPGPTAPDDVEPPIDTNDTPVDPETAITATSDTFMVTLSGLFENLTPDWVDALGEVTTPRMRLAIARTAQAIQRADSRAVGQLRDSKRNLRVSASGDRAIATSCLDEKNWYVIDNETLRADPGIARGYFVGRANFVRVDGRWLVDVWNSLPEPCTPADT